MLATSIRRRWKTASINSASPPRTSAAAASQATIVVEADTAAKPTQYLRSETDMTVQLDGATFTLARIYDSLTTGLSRIAGLRLEPGRIETRFHTSIPPTGLEADGIYNPFVVGTRVYLTLPDGSRAGFTFSPSAPQAGLIYYTPAYTADSGVTYTLTSAAAELMQAGNRFYDLKTGQPYNPASGFFTGPDYTLTGPDGTVYADQHVARRGGGDAAGRPDLADHRRAALIAPNGDRLTFTRDASGRLTSVTAPDGSEVLYAYDSAGNLVSRPQPGAGTIEPLRLQCEPAAPAGTWPFRPCAAQSVVIQYAPGPVVLPLTADLGSSGHFLTARKAAHWPPAEPTATASTSALRKSLPPTTGLSSWASKSRRLPAAA